MLPENRIENQRRRTARARKFGVNTCPASRHLHNVADALMSKSKYPIEEIWEPEHIAASIYAVLESLWKDRDALIKAGIATQSERAARRSRARRERADG